MYSPRSETPLLSVHQAWSFLLSHQDFQIFFGKSCSTRNPRKPANRIQARGDSDGKKIHSKISASTEAFAYHDDGLSNEERIVQMRQQVRNFVDELLAEPNKTPVSDRDIRLRLNGFLKHELDSEAQRATIPPEISALHSDGRTEHFTQDHFLDLCAEETAQGANTLENASEWHDLNLIELVQREVFSRNEITQSNALAIARSFERVKATMLRIRAARSRGDFS